MLPLSPLSLTDTSFLKNLFRELGIAPAHTRSQNFLTCPQVIHTTLQSLTSGPRHITELGAGLGTLTWPLLEAGFKVRAIEKDGILASVLTRLTPSPQQKNLELLILDLKNTAWEHNTPYQLVGNIPYHLSGYIIRRLTQLVPPPQRTILLVQKEVGERMMAKPPDMQLLGLAVQLWGAAKKLQLVRRGCFWPAPKVDSMLVQLLPHTASQVAVEQREYVLEVARTFFQARRKQMGGVLKKRGWERGHIEDALKKAEVLPTARPQELSVSQWIKLAEYFPRYS